MILYNGKKLSTADKDEPFVKMYNRQIEWIKNNKYFERFVFVHPDNRRKRKEDGSYEVSEGALVPFREKMITDFGEFDVIYYDTTFLNKHGKEEYRPRRFNFTGLNQYKKESHYEKIWFLIFVSPHVEHIIDIKNQQNQNRKRTFFKVQDSRGDAELRYDIMNKVGEAYHKIFNKEELNGELLITVARHFGVKRLDKMSDEQLRLELSTKVLKMKHGTYGPKLIDEFFEILPETGKRAPADNAQAKAVYNELIEKAIIKHKLGEERSEWLYEPGGELIFKHSSADAPEAAFINHLIKNPEVLKDFQAKLKEARPEKPKRTRKPKK